MPLLHFCWLGRNVKSLGRFFFRLHLVIFEDRWGFFGLFFRPIPRENCIN